MRHPPKSAGLTIVELVVSVMLVAVIMASVALAMHASLTNYTTNQDNAVATHACRTVLNRIAEEVRTATSVNYADGSSLLRITLPPSNDTVTYQYSNNQLLYTRKQADGTVLVDGAAMLGGTGDEVTVTSFSAVKEQGKDADGVTCTVNVALELKAKVGDQQILMRASASPRRNMTY